MHPGGHALIPRQATRATHTYARRTCMVIATTISVGTRPTVRTAWCSAALMTDPASQRTSTNAPPSAVQTWRCTTHQCARARGQACQTSRRCSRPQGTHTRSRGRARRCTQPPPVAFRCRTGPSSRPEPTALNSKLAVNSADGMQPARAAKSARTPVLRPRSLQHL